MNETTAVPMTKERAGEIALEISIRELRRKDASMTRLEKALMIKFARIKLAEFNISPEEATSFVEFLVNEVNKP